MMSLKVQSSPYCIGGSPIHMGAMGLVQFRKFPGVAMDVGQVALKPAFADVLKKDVLGDGMFSHELQLTGISTPQVLYWPGRRHCSGMHGTQNPAVSAPSTAEYLPIGHIVQNWLEFELYFPASQS